MSFRKHALLVTDEEITYILCKLVDDFDELLVSSHEDDKKAIRLFQNRYDVDYDDFYKRCQDVFQIFREEAFK